MVGSKQIKMCAVVEQAGNEAWCQAFKGPNSEAKNNRVPNPWDMHCWYVFYMPLQPNCPQQSI